MNPFYSRIAFSGLAILLLNSCSPKLLIGSYHTYSKSGILMAGKTINFEEGNKFEMKIWADNISSNMLGRGTYLVDEKSLKFTFEDIGVEQNEVNEKPIESSGTENNIIRIRTFDKDHLPLIGVNVSLKNLTTNEILYGVTNGNGEFSTFDIKPEATQVKLMTSYLGMMDLEYETDASSKLIEVVLAQKNKYFTAGDNIEYEYRIRGDKLILKSEYPTGQKRVEKLVHK